jgi:hypothetical protein
LIAVAAPNPLAPSSNEPHGHGVVPDGDLGAHAAGAGPVAPELPQWVVVIGWRLGAGGQARIHDVTPDGWKDDAGGSAAGGEGGPAEAGPETLVADVLTHGLPGDDLLDSLAAFGFPLGPRFGAGPGVGAHGGVAGGFGGGGGGSAGARPQGGADGDGPSKTEPGLDGGQSPFDPPPTLLDGGTNPSDPGIDPPHWPETNGDEPHGPQTFTPPSINEWGAGHEPSAAPEPSTWAMAILGFALVGARVRGRRRRGATV